jgi:hypothetical protein
MARPLLYATAAYAGMAQTMASTEALDLGEVERRFFPDGERYADLPGEVVTAKTRARLLSSVPAAANGNRVLLLDLHVPGIAHYFERELHPTHLTARGLIGRIVRELGGERYTLGCVDAGRAKSVQRLALDLGAQVAFVYKRRDSDRETHVSGVSAHVAGRPVVIRDPDLGGRNPRRVPRGGHGAARRQRPVLRHRDHRLPSPCRRPGGWTPPGRVGRVVVPRRPEALTRSDAHGPTPAASRRCVVGVVLLASIGRRFHQPMPVAYIVAGVLLGPHGVGLLDDTEVLTHIGEYGVILLLFLLGTEIKQYPCPWHSACIRSSLRKEKPWPMTTSPAAP